MQTNAVVLAAPGQLGLRSIALDAPTPADVTVEVEWSGVSTGTERLLFSGRMPPFPGLGYPLVPGYESVGRVVACGAEAPLAPGTLVFVPGANCYGEVRGLFGGAASHIVTPAARVVAVPEGLGARSVLLALAATAQHVLHLPGTDLPDLIVGHGTLGRLLARLTAAAGGSPMVWETQAARRDGARGYAVADPAHDGRRDYRTICDASGDAGLLDTLVARLAPGGTIVLAGFYSAPLSFAFPPAFMREARILVAAQWQKPDLERVAAMAASGTLCLNGLTTHAAPAAQAPAAYATAFDDPACLKMVLDWSTR